MTKVYWIPFSHLDLGFYGSRQEALSRGNRTITLAMEMARKEKNFRFLIETVNFVENFVMSHPEQVAELRKHVHSGKIELLPEWSGIFQNCIDGEVMVRNILYSKVYLDNKFGVNPPSIQFSDIGELTPQIPQILRNLEVYHCVNSRGGPENTAVYWMEGLDGSRVLVLNQLLGYAWAMVYTRFGTKATMENLKTSKLDEHIKFFSNICPVSVGMQYGLDGLVPTKDIWELARNWNSQSEAKILFATLSEYFKIIQEERNSVNIPVIKGELRGVWVGGTGASPSTVHDTETISMLLTAEKFVTIAYLMRKLENPTDEIQEIWTYLLNAFDHNGGPKNKVDRQVARIKIEYLLEKALSSIAENVETPKGAYVVPIVVFNPLSWKRDGVVSLHYSQYSTLWEMPFCNSEFVYKALGIDLAYEPENLEITDASGNIVPCDGEVTDRFLLPNGNLTFIAEGVPPLGYKTFYLQFKEKTKPAVLDLDLNETDDYITAMNNEVKLKVDRASGALSMEDPKSGKTLMENAHLVLYELTEKGTWVKEVDFNKKHLLKVEDVQVEKNGPVKLETKVLGELLGAQIQVICTLYNKADFIDLTIKIKGNFSKKGFLVFHVPTTLANPRIDYGVPYGTNKWENYVDKCKPGDETPLSLWKLMRNMEKFVVLSNENNSVVIASYGKGFRKENDGISLTMLYSASEDEEPSKEEKIFKHRFTVGGSDKAVKAYKTGWEFISPLIPMGIYDTNSSKNLPVEQSFCKTSSYNTVVTTIKMAETSDNIVVRYYEAEGKKSTAGVEFMGKARGTQANMLERPLKDKKQEATQLRPYEIRTVLFPTVKD